MRPTPDGLKMYTMAKDLLSHANSINNEFTNAKENVSLSLRVDQNIRIAVLEHFIRELHENTENINLTLLHSNDGNDSACDMQLIPQSKSHIDPFNDGNHQNWVGCHAIQNTRKKSSIPKKIYTKIKRWIK